MRSYLKIKKKILQSLPGHVANLRTDATVANLRISINIFLTDNERDVSYLKCLQYTAQLFHNDQSMNSEVAYRLLESTSEAVLRDFKLGGFSLLRTII